ncbi:MAG: carboxy terminal-processing peptidase [Chthoniobacterales bacterium]
MNVNSLGRLLFSIAILCLFATPERYAFSSDLEDKGRVEESVSRLLEKIHYSRKTLDDQMSKVVLKNYLDSLDYNRLFFTQQDISEFDSKYGSQLDDAILSGNLEPAKEIFDRFKQRVEERIAKVKILIGKDYKFDSDKVVQINRTKAAWPKDEAEADAIWEARIQGDLLLEKLDKHPLSTPQKVIGKRYNQLLKSIREEDNEDVFRAFMTALAQSYDPHTEYFTPADYENFTIMMKHSLIGVGAVLRADDGYAKVMEVVPGGPADRDGRLKVNDRISAVAQGTGEFEDVVDMKLDKVVEKIRGKKGSKVRLQVIPGGANDPSKRKVIEIVRDEVNLKDQEAKAELIDLKQANGRVAKIGWITLPSFYSDMQHRGSERTTSTTEDVRILLERLKQEGIEGLVIDLRKNGGGSLEEAIDLTGLFVHGPAVQVKDTNGNVKSSESELAEPIYTGPMVVLINRLSASATEIFAAALQDYGRAVVAGDERSFGKGTVQTLIEINKVMPLFSLGSSDAGALKLTIQKFYRVKGGSTQLRGVQSDIVLPSPTDNPEIGESAFKNPLEYDEVAPALKIDANVASGLYLDELRHRSEARVAQDPEFTYIKQDDKRFQEKIDRNTVSLNEKQRRQEIQQDKERIKARNTERATRKPMDAVDYEITLDNVNSKKLQQVSLVKKHPASSFDEEDADDNKDKDKDKETASKPDPIRDEAIRILHDLTDLQNSKKTASIPDKTVTKQ